MGYITKNYREQGGEKWVVGGELDVTGTLKMGDLTLNTQVAQVTFTPAAGAANVCDVVIQAKDANGTNVARPVLLIVWLSDAATGLGLTATAASGTVQAKSASGADFGVLTAKKALVVQTLATGAYTLEITDTSKTGYYIGATMLGATGQTISAHLVTANYGT